MELELDPWGFRLEADPAKKAWRAQTVVRFLCVRGNAVRNHGNRLR